MPVTVKTAGWPGLIGKQRWAWHCFGVLGEEEEEPAALRRAARQWVEWVRRSIERVRQKHLLTEASRVP